MLDLSSAEGGKNTCKICSVVMPPRRMKLKIAILLAFTIAVDNLSDTTKLAINVSTCGDIDDQLAAPKRVHRNDKCKKNQDLKFHSFRRHGGTANFASIFSTLCGRQIQRRAFVTQDKYRIRN
jgi:hypothetical protein